MTIRVGILGLGFMGKCHYETYAKLSGVKVEAVCDIDPEKRKGHIGHAFGNIDLTGKQIYKNADELFADKTLDVIDVDLPTFLHAEYTISALQAGKHVICEKPMARTTAEAKSMITAAQKTGKKLFLAQCVRFWPAYAKAREIVLSGKYGKVLTARFCRISPKPMWSWDGWLATPARSGLCALDLHVHDADFVQFLFGRPKSVRSVGFSPIKGAYDHIFTSYDFGDGKLVTAEGAWEYAPGFPFAMTFQIAMEKASLDMTADTKLMLYPWKGKPAEVKVQAGDGYQHELKHFLHCIRTNTDSDIVTPESAMNSVKMIECELESIKTGKAAPVRF
jgi:predicted dehydrogenase